jgi:hypothetical protein
MAGLAVGKLVLLTRRMTVAPTAAVSNQELKAPALSVHQIHLPDWALLQGTSQTNSVNLPLRLQKTQPTSLLTEKSLKAQEV